MCVCVCARAKVLLLVATTTVKASLQLSYSKSRGMQRKAGDTKQSERMRVYGCPYVIPDGACTLGVKCGARGTLVAFSVIGYALCVTVCDCV